jgi:hypothetical protein
MDLLAALASGIFFAIFHAVTSKANLLKDINPMANYLLVMFSRESLALSPFTNGIAVMFYLVTGFLFLYVIGSIIRKVINRLK